jgi:hypothetical protein
MKKGLFIKGEQIASDPVFLTAETSRLANTVAGHDARCIICLEPCYRSWIDRENPPPPGCLSGHTRKEDCIEHAVPQAVLRGKLLELKKRGLINL